MTAALARFMAPLMWPVGSPVRFLTLASQGMLRIDDKPGLNWQIPNVHLASIV